MLLDLASPDSQRPEGGTVLSLPRYVAPASLQCLAVVLKFSTLGTSESYHAALVDVVRYASGDIRMLFVACQGW